ncbi:MAG: heparinase II/III family protein [Bacteroidetes bacterium]|nr:heparinase II/III family protein [Bacteroidota bacterium]
MIKPREIETMDIRFIWELSRFQLPPSILNQKGTLTRYTKLFEIKNPVFFGPNWVSPMEVGIRAVNILIHHINTSNDSKFTSKLLHNSFHFILNNLDNHNFHKGNHYLINLCSLLFLTSKSNYTNEKKINYLINELESEIILQYNKDGSYYENSTYYHFFVTEALCQTIYFIKNESTNSILNKIIENDSRLQENNTIIDILRNALSFSSSINYKNIIFPIIGDEDSGRFIYTSEKINDLGQEFYQIIPNRIKDVSRFKTTLIQSHDNNIRCENKYSLTVEEINYCHFKDFGLLVIKSKNFFLTLRSNYCEKKMVHAHEDLGSINLIINEQILLWDPGTYTYNRNIDERNYFRSGKNHNVQLVNSSVEKLKSPFVFEFNAETKFSIQEIKGSIVVTFEMETDKEKVKRKILIQSNGIYIFCSPETSLKFPIKFSPAYGKVESAAHPRSIYSL